MKPPFRETAEITQTPKTVRLRFTLLLMTLLHLAVFLMTQKIETLSLANLKPPERTETKYKFSIPKGLSPVPTPAKDDDAPSIPAAPSVAAPIPPPAITQSVPAETAPETDGETSQESSRIQEEATQVNEPVRTVDATELFPDEPKVEEKSEPGEPSPQTEEMTDLRIDTNPGAVALGDSSNSDVARLGGLSFDTDDFDWNPYALKLYWAIYRNWLRLMPPAVQFGEKGVCSYRFRILKNGTIEQLEAVTSTGKLSLDMAAQNAVSLSNPLPPLPPDFPEERDSLGVTVRFFYNIDPNEVP